MKRGVVAFACGLLFALGLGVSGMTHPSKVLAFLDVTGAWDPSLAFVMGGGVLVNLVVFRRALRRGAPLLASSFAMPTRAGVDAGLVVGAAIFGVGWGMGGFCPGPAIVSAVTGAMPVVAFVVAMMGTMALLGVSIERPRAKRALESEV
ncbi:MAG TPA: DUF6691 family protein [Polyangiaceae bacterium]